MLFDLIRTVAAAVLVGVLPGYFWARFLVPSHDRTTRIVFGMALSMTLVPSVALAGVYIFGTGVTLSIALASVAVVFVSGLAVHHGFGSAKGTGEPLAPRPAPPGILTLALTFVALGLLLARTLGVFSGRWAGISVVVLLFFAGVTYLIEAGESEATEEGSSWVWRLLLPAALLLTLVRGYSGIVLHDWPHIRGIDQYTQAIMTNLMASEGTTEAYMVYPPGFHLLMAMISRISGLGPLDIFPVLGPALLLLPALALYVLANRIWGREAAVLAALFSGVVLGSSYIYLSEARYPQLISVQFLSVLAVAALFGLFASPSRRAIALFALLGSSVVLYHHVGSFFLALLLASVAVLLLPYLLLRDRRRGLALFLSFALLGVLAVLYAWDPYDLPRTLAEVIGISEASGSDATGAAVSGAIGTQPAYPLRHLPQTLSSAVLWLGLLGALFAFPISRDRTNLPYTLARITLLLWTAIMFAGSRTTLSGFPERFERDLGVPLALLAAFALSLLLRPVGWSVGGRTLKLKPLAVMVAALAALFVGLQGWQSIEQAAEPAARKSSYASSRLPITPEVEAAGEWLRKNNEGGTILAVPYLENVPSRALLAMGGYSDMQTFTKERIRRNRDLPPSGQGPPRDAFQVLQRPLSERAREVIEEYDVRYVVLYKGYPGVYWRLFESHPDLYRKTFEDGNVLIYATNEAE